MAGDIRLPSGWRYVSTGELEDEGVIAEIQDGNHGERHPKSTDYVPFGVPFIMAKDLEGGRLNLGDCSFIPRSLADSLRIGFAKPGDVLLTHKATMGRVAIVPDGFEYVMLTPQVTYYRIGDSKRLSNTYLKYAFLGADFQHQLNSDSDQSTRKYIGITAQRRLRVPFPPPAEQRAIANILGMLDEKIELNRRMNETLEAIARALFKSWFVDFDPVRAKAEARDPGLPKHLADLFPDSFEDSETGEIPKGWATGSLADTIEILGGGTPKTSVSEYWNGAIPWFSVVDAPRDADVWVVDTEKKITQAGVENSSTRVLPEGTTIITARGTVGRIALVGVPMAMNQSCYGLRGKIGTHGSFTYFAIRKLVSTLQQRSHGSVFDTITRDTLAGVVVGLPPATSVEAFEQLVHPTLGRIRNNLFECRTLAALRDTLLPKLISGELRLKDAERLIQGHA